MIDFSVIAALEPDEFVAGVAQQGLRVEGIQSYSPLHLQMTGGGYDIVGSYNSHIELIGREIWSFMQVETSLPSFVLIQTKGMDDYILWWIDRQQGNQPDGIEV